MRRTCAAIVGVLAIACGRGWAAPPDDREAAEQAHAGLDAMLAEISAERVTATVEKLASFGTRHTLSDTASEVRGIGAARRWIKTDLEQAFRAGQKEFASRVAGNQPLADIPLLRPWPGEGVTFDSHTVQPDGRRIDVPAEIVNVVAVLPGAMPEARDRLIYITGHYDSINADVMDRTGDAPGANDDASGVAVLMECARVMSKRSFDCTIVFMATAGEEQGLLGARLHAQKAREAGKNIVAVLNNDIIGDPAGPLARDSEAAGAARRTIRLFSEGVPKQAAAIELAQIALLGAESDSGSRQLARYVAEVAERHGLAVRPTLVFRNDRFMRGGDHTAFLEAGFAAAVRFTAPHEDYSRQHANIREVDGKPYGDLPAFVEGEYLANVARLNAAAAAHLANAPSPPQDVRIITAKLGNETTIRWTKSPEPDVAGYEVLVRLTTAPLWQQIIDAGAGEEWTGSVSKDDHLFGVRAFDREGHRSVTTFARAARE